MRVPSLFATLLATAVLGACAHHPVYGRPGSSRGGEPDWRPQSGDNYNGVPQPHTDTPSKARPDSPRPHPHSPTTGATPHIPVN